MCATDDWTAEDNSGHCGSVICPASRAYFPHRPQVAVLHLGSLTQKGVLRSAVQTTMLIAGTRRGRWLAALPAIGGS